MSTMHSFSARAATAALVLFSAALPAAVPAAAQSTSAQRAAHWATTPGAAAVPLAGASTSDASIASTVVVGQNARLLVKFNKRTPQLSRRQTLKRLGAKQVEALGPLGVVVVEVSRPRAHSVLEALRASPQVDFAERDAVSQASYTPNDPQYNGSASPCYGSLGCWPYQNVNLASAWNATTGSSSVIVAVVDTGVDASHEDLAGAVLTGCNLVSGTITGGVCSDTDTSDDNGHGTQAAGLIAARINNGLGVPGVCGSCKILPVKALNSGGGGSDSNIALGIEWAADNGANVISLSLAGGTADPVLHDAIAYAISKGVLVVAAAGNAGSSNPATYPGGYPAAFTGYSDSSGGAPISSGLISVAADDYFNHLYSFSNHGSWVDISAPGCGISTSYDGGYDTSGFCGTSAAAPFVAGVAALMLSYNSSLTPAQLQSGITSSATTGTGDDVVYGELNALGALEAAGYSATVAPSNTVAPAISGSPVDGQTLSVSDGSWDGYPTPTYSYAWSRCNSGGASCVATGTTSASYALSASDVGSTLKATVTAENSDGSASASALSAVVAAAPPANTALPTVSGSSAPVVGDVLSVANGSWSGTATISYAYRWQSSPDGTTWTDISGATASTYTAQTGDAGDYLRVKVTASNSAGSAAAYSATSGRVEVAPSSSSAPALSGGSAPVVGDTLSTSNGSWSGYPTPAYVHQWQRSTNGTTWTDISGATASTYTAQAGDTGDYLRVKVTATNSVGSAASYSDASAAKVAATAVAPSSSVAPTVSGGSAPTVGDTLSASTGTWSGAPSPTYSYQWQSSPDGTTWTDISGATASTYTAQAGDTGDYLRAEVRASNSAGSAAAYSAAGGQVAAAPHGGGSGGSGGGGGGGGGAGGGSSPDTSLELTTAQAPVVGQQLVYQLRVYDKLNYGATWDTLATAVLPDQVAITSVYTPHGGCTSSGQTVKCDLVWLNPGQSVTVLIFTTVNTGGTLTASASCSAQGEQDLRDNQTTLTETVGATGQPPVTTPPVATPPGKSKSGPVLALPSTIRLVPLGTGAVAVGSTLTVSPTLKIKGLRYRWQVRGTKGYTNLSGQTAPTLRLTSALAGKQVRVIVTSGKQSRTSAPTMPIRKR